MTDTETIRSALSEILGEYDVREAYVYGSYARNEQTPASDIDLRFVCGGSITYGDLYRIVLRLEHALKTDVDLLTCRPEKLRPGFYDGIRHDEVKLYEAA